MTENTENKYEEYNGRLLNLIPRLQSEERQPLSIEGVMRGRLEGIACLETTVDTCDAIAIHPTGRRKLLRSSELLLNITSQTKTSYGVLPITEREYSHLLGYEFTEQEFRDFAKPREYPSAICTNPLWKIVVSDHNLLEKYAQHVSKSSKEKSEPSKDIMGIYCAAKQKMPVLIPLALQDLAHKSYLAPSSFLDKDGAHVVVYTQAGSPQRSTYEQPSLKNSADQSPMMRYIWSSGVRRITILTEV